MAARVTRTTLPPSSSVWQPVGANDFIDCYAVPCILSPRQAAERAFVFPKWVKLLMVIRNFFARAVRLNTAPAATDRIGFFPVTHEDADEIVMGFNDRHLDFRVVIRVEDGRAFGATWVHRHNLLGRIYLLIVLPFHILIMRGSMARIGRAETIAD